jgi:hypothetical protein
MSKKGCIYILTNPSFKDYVKIGFASNIERRLRELNRSECIPYAFRVYATYEVDEELSDKKVHSIIDQLNPNLRAIDEFDGKPRVREFYEMSAEEAYTLLENIAAISGTKDRLHKYNPKGHEIKDEEMAEAVRTEHIERRSPFSFEKCHINAGEELTFYKHPEIKAYVNDDRTIKLNGTITSLSASAQMITNMDHPLQGTMYWCYKGRTLKEIRNDLEEKGEYK